MSQENYIRERFKADSILPEQIVVLSGIIGYTDIDITGEYMDKYEKIDLTANNGKVNIAVRNRDIKYFHYHDLTLRDTEVRRITDGSSNVDLYFLTYTENGRIVKYFLFDGKKIAKLIRAKPDVLAGPIPNKGKDDTSLYALPFKSIPRQWVIRQWQASSPDTGKEKAPPPLLTEGLSYS